MLDSGWWSWAGVKSVTVPERAGHQAVRVALCFLLFVLYVLLIGIVVVTIPFIWCSVKLPLCRPTSFFLFLSILLPAPIGGGVIEQAHGPFIAGHGQTTTKGD